MLVIGLTGGIGSGKSTVAELFSGLGVPVIDTDRIAHELTVSGSAALAAIHQAFGDSVISNDGSLDRTILRDIVFGDAAARKKLEAILHPRIRREVESSLDSLDAPYVLLVIPLLVEAGGYADLIDRVLVIDCPEALQVSRVITRNGMSQQEVMAIMAAQASRDRRLQSADDVIVNGDMNAGLKEEVKALHLRYRALALRCKP